MKRELLDKLTAVWYLNESHSDEQLDVVQRFDVLTILNDTQFDKIDSCRLWEIVCSEALIVADHYAGKPVSELFEEAERDSICLGQLPAEVFAFCEDRSETLNDLSGSCRALSVALNIDAAALNDNLIVYCYEQHCSPLKTISFLQCAQSEPNRTSFFRSSLQADDGDSDCVSFYCLAEDEDDAADLALAKYPYGRIRHTERLEINEYPSEYIKAAWRV